MRLTLRTMLAYLDDMLKPSDTAELGRRIEESKFASELVERIRVSTRRPRLAAPKVDGRGIGLDPNSVAEYLDSTLPPERVADFERVCLESDVHLAEVAACHQILTRVLAGEPARVPAGLRDRMLLLGTAEGEQQARVARAAAKKSRAAASQAVRAAEGDVTAPPIADVEVAAPPIAAPVGSGTSTMPWIRGALALGICLALVLVGLRAVGPFDARHPLASLFGGGVEVAQAPGDSDGGDAPTAPPADAARPFLENASSAPSEESTPAGADEDRRAGVDRAAAAPNLDGLAADLADGAAGADDVKRAKEAAGVEPAGEPNLAPPGEPKRPAADKADATPVDLRPADPAAPEVADDPAPGVAPIAPDGVRPAAASVPAVSAPGLGKPAPAKPGLVPSGPGKLAKPKPAAVEPAPAAIEVGRLVSEDQVLAHIDPTDGLWHRLMRGASLAAGRHYVALPHYRPQVLVGTSAQLLVVGPADFQLLPGADDSMQGGVSLERGRAVVTPAAKPGARVPLVLAGLPGSVVFGEANAELAVEIRRFLPPGSDPAHDETAGTRITRTFFARRGAVEWRPDGGDPVRIPPDQVLVLIDGEEPTLQKSVFPTWTEVRNISKLDRDAFEQLETFLPPDRPLTLSLEERLDFRKTEIRSLAARSLAALGEYEALVRELSNDQQHSYWDRTVDDLRDALARGPAEAARVREAVQRVRTEEVETLMRLLRDYSPEQLDQAGGAAELVGYLDHKSLDVRVLAFETLRRITGVTLYYRPEAPSERRRVPLQKWRERLKDGLVVYKTPPGSELLFESPPPPPAAPAAAKP